LKAIDGLHRALGQTHFELLSVSLQLGASCLLLSIVTEVSLSLSALSLQHRCFICLYYLTSLVLCNLFDMPLHAFVCFIPILAFWFSKFHVAVQWVSGPCIAMGFAICIASVMWYLTMESRLQNTFDALKSEEAAHSQLKSRLVVLERMRDSLFDASCMCELKSGVVKSTTPQFDFYFTDAMCGMPLLLLGATPTSQRLLRDLIIESGGRGTDSACVATVTLATNLGRFSLVTDLGGATPSSREVQLFMVMQPTISACRLDRTRIFVGMQLSDDLCALDNTSTSTDVSMDATSHMRVDPQDSITPDDSISMCWVRMPSPVRTRRAAESDPG